jgi:hypothetical protein
MRQIVSTALASLLTVTLTAPATAAHAAAGSADTPCTAQIYVDLDPGVSMQPSSGTFHSNGQDGSLTCSGPIAGRQPVAGGKGGAAGKYGVDGPNSCYQLTGKTEFTISATLPTEHGVINFVDHVTGEYGPGEANWFFGGSFHGQKSYGTFKFTPVDSDCVVRPVRRLFVDATAFIKSDS